MARQVYFDQVLVIGCDADYVLPLKSSISQKYGVPVEDLYATCNGKLLNNDANLKNSCNVVRVFSKLVGGKGGFGSMLRAIGAQIEKTTNREACRDLSGRRLRDINEEKRLRKWLEGQEDREKEAMERKQKKLERLLTEPKVVVNMDSKYHKEREALPERVSAAVDAGWEAAGSSGEKGTKRKAETENATKKKAKLWIDAELSDCSSLSDSDDEEPKQSPGQLVSTDSGNESDKPTEKSII